jgi:D-glycero-alpha-D-manno-heptose-7-phosphate kinase
VRTSAPQTSALEPYSEAVLARAPLRVSLGGGGTDLPSYAQRHGGLVVSLAIDRHVAVTVYPRAFDGGVHAVLEGRILADRRGTLSDRFVNAILARAKPEGNMQITTVSDAPSGTGLGGSGAFSVALLHALRRSQRPTAGSLAEEASAVERLDLGRPVGKHDHYMAAFGGLRALRIDSDLSVSAEEISVSDAVHHHLRDGLLLFYTGLARDAGLVLGDQDRMTRSGDTETMGSLRAIHGLADEMLSALMDGRVDDIGPVLAEHWRNKAKLSDRVSNRRIDELYQTALGAGADGGKLLGAGGGGFLLLSCRSGRADELRAALAEQGLRELPFAVCGSGSEAVGISLSDT